MGARDVALRRPAEPAAGEHRGLHWRHEAGVHVLRVPAFGVLLHAVPGGRVDGDGVDGASDVADLGGERVQGRVVEPDVATGQDGHLARVRAAHHRGGQRVLRAQLVERGRGGEDLGHGRRAQRLVRVLVKHDLAGGGVGDPGVEGPKVRVCGGGREGVDKQLLIHGRALRGREEAGRGLQRVGRRVLKRCEIALRRDAEPRDGADSSERERAHYPSPYFHGH